MHSHPPSSPHQGYHRQQGTTQAHSDSHLQSHPMCRDPDTALTLQSAGLDPVSHWRRWACRMRVQAHTTPITIRLTAVDGWDASRTCGRTPLVGPSQCCSPSHAAECSRSQPLPEISRRPRFAEISHWPVHMSHGGLLSHAAHVLPQGSPPCSPYAVARPLTLRCGSPPLLACPRPAPHASSAQTGRPLLPAALSRLLTYKP